MGIAEGSLRNIESGGKPASPRLVYRLAARLGLAAEDILAIPHDRERGAA